MVGRSAASWGSGRCPIGRRARDEQLGIGARQVARRPGRRVETRRRRNPRAWWVAARLPGDRDAALSGGALGMNSSGLVRGKSLAVPAVVLKRVVGEILVHGGSQRGFLGIGTLPYRAAPSG